MKVKVLLTTLVFLLMIQNIYGLKLGITPAEITFKGIEKENICKNISIYSNEYQTIVLETRWAMNISKVLKDYEKKSFEIRISENFSEVLRFKNRKEIEICLKFNDPGEYYGAIIASPVKNEFGVGSWINAKILEKRENNNQMFLTLIFSTIISTINLIGLLIVNKIKERSF